MLTSIHTSRLMIARLPGADLLSRFLARVTSKRSLMRERRALARLDAHMLEDIGLTREQAMTEAARPAWDVPSNWRGVPGGFGFSAASA